MELPRAGGRGPSYPSFSLVSIRRKEEGKEGDGHVVVIFWGWWSIGEDTLGISERESTPSDLKPVDNRLRSMRYMRFGNGGHSVMNRPGYGVSPTDVTSTDGAVIVR